MAEMEKLGMEALDELAGGKGLGESLKKRYNRMSKGQKTALWSVLGVGATAATAGAVDQLATGGKGRKYLGGKIKEGAGKVAEAVKGWMPGKKNIDVDKGVEIEVDDAGNYSTKNKYEGPMNNPNA